MQAKVLVVGGGGREHAIAARLHNTGSEIFAVMRNRNPGITRISSAYLICPENELEKICEFGKKNHVDFAVCGPEEPLVHGLADVLGGAGIPCVGPGKAGAQIEGSKFFARELMRKHSIPGLVDYVVAGDVSDAMRAFDKFGDKFVIKPIGLTGGKGVKIMGEQLATRADAIAYVNEIIEKGIGQHREMLIEEKVEGEEFTLQAFVNEKSIAFAPLVQDHKRLYEGDTGPNTGGMGSYSCSDFMLPFITKEDHELAMEIMRRTVEALANDGIVYRGFLYGQFMATADGVRVIEFNCRLGDPEAMNVLSIHDDDFTELCFKIAHGERFSETGFRKEATVCKYVVPEGYGTKMVSQSEIRVNEEAITGNGCRVYYAMVNEENGVLMTTTSRALAIVGCEKDIESAERHVEHALNFVKGRFYVRHDIGKKELIQKRILHMQKIRGS